MSNNPDKPAKPQRNPPPNPFAAGGNPAVSSSLPVADSTHGGKSAAPPAKPSFLLGKEPSAKPSNPFFAGSDTNKAESAIAGNPVNVGETFGNDTSRVVTNPSANTFGAEPVFSAPPIPPLATPVTVATSLPAPPLPPVPPPETPKISSESHESFGPTIPPPIPIAAVESFASEVSTPHNLPPPPPAVPIVIEPPNLPPVPPTFDLSPPPTSNKSLFPEPILGAPPTSFGDDDPFAIDVKPHSLSAPSAKVVENPFAPKAPAKSNVSDPFSSPAPSGGFDSFGSSSKVSSDPFAASSDPFSTTQKPLSTPVDFGASDPFATPVTATAFAASSDPFATSAPVAPSSTSKVSNPFAPPPLPSSAAPPVRPPRRPSADPFTAATALDPFATPTSAVHPPIPATIPTTSPSSFVADPFASTATTDPFLTPTVAVHPPIPASVPAVAPHFDSSFPAPPVPAIPVQEDDDPYLIITNKPPPVVPVAPTQPPKPVIKAKEDAPKKPKEGDPFDIPLPGLEKPKTSEPAKPVDPTASIPLKELIKIKQAPAPAPAVPTQTAPNAPVNPFSPNASNKPPATSTAPVVAPIPFTSTPVTVNSVTPQHPVAADPFSTTNDPFGPSSTPLFPAPAKPVVHDDPFASSSSTFNDDPFGNAFSAPSVPTTKSSAHPVVDDFDIFNKPTPHPAPANAKATPLNVPPPMPAKPHKAAPSQPATATLPKTTPAVPASGNLLEGDWIDASSTANKPKQTVHDGTFDDMDPFTVQAVDDPFASQPSDDPFASEGATDSHEDMLEKFRLMYGVKGQADDDGHDIYDSDFDDDFDHPKGKSSASSTAKSSSKPAGDGSVPQGLAYGEMLARGTNPEVIDGEILSRLSTKSLVVKDWHDTYYIIIKGFLFLYKTKLDYQYNPKGTNYKKKLPITYNLSVSPLKAKEYKGYGTVYNFMLEEVMDYGRTNIGKFGSTLKPVAENLWKQLRAVILYKRHIRTHPPAQYK